MPTARFRLGVLVALVICWAGDAPAQILPRGTVADRVVVEKASRTLSLYGGGKLLKSYKIALGKNPVGPKEREGEAPAKALRGALMQ